MWRNSSSTVETPATTSRLTPAKVGLMKPVAAVAENDFISAGSATRVVSTALDSRSLLGSSLQIKGEISGNEDLHVDCSVDGLIHLDGHKVTVGANAKIVANIVAAEIIVYGNVKGNLSADARIEIKKDGSVVGELTTSRIMIEDGALFKGTIAIDRKTGTAAANVEHTTHGGDEQESAPNLSGGAPTLYPISIAKERAGA
jgi:cytoskeletal protein CcmA (bactofilin family)